MFFTTLIIGFRGYRDFRVLDLAKNLSFSDDFDCNSGNNSFSPAPPNMKTLTAMRNTTIIETNNSKDVT